MKRALAPLLCFASLVAPEAVEAQARRPTTTTGGTTTPGRTRRVEARRVVRDSPSRTTRDERRAVRVARSSGSRWIRRRRVRIALVPGVPLDEPCDRIVDGDCIQDRWEYVGESMVGFGFSAGLVGSVMSTSNNPLSTARVVGGGIDAGVLPAVGLDGRAFLVHGRFRVGGVLQGGAAAVPSAVSLAGAFEEGSSLGGGFQLGVWGTMAYAPQVADILQLWIGGRVGWHLLELDVRWQSRLYDRVSRSFVSAGPELGVRFDDGGPAGLMLWVFADLAQPGLVQATLAFHFEEPRPPSPVW